MYFEIYSEIVILFWWLFRSYSESNFDINFWRTKSGLEVDFILGKGQTALEVKGTKRVDKTDLKGIRAFIEEYSPKKAIIVCNEKKERITDNISIIPWKKFLTDLWQNKII
ncbi:hypothetical protein ACFL4S_00670 [bacterium]